MGKPINPEKNAELALVIERMSANGLSPQQISLLTGIKAGPLYRRFRDAMMKGGARRLDEVAEAAYMMATGGGKGGDWRRADAGMNRFWLERHGGPAWAAPSRDQEDGPDLTRLTVPQLMELERALRPLARNPVLIDGTVGEQHAEPRERGGGVDASGAGAESAGGERVDLPGEGEVPD